MAFNPVQPINIPMVQPPVTYGGQGAQYMSGAIDSLVSILQRLKEERDRQQLQVGKAISGINDEDLVVEAQKIWYGDKENQLYDQVAEWYQYDDNGKKKSIFEKGTLTPTQQARLASEIKNTQSQLTKFQNDYKSYKSAQDQLLKDQKGYYDENVFKQRESEFFNTGSAPEGGFLEQAPIDLGSDIINYNDNLRKAGMVTDSENYKNGELITTRDYNANELQKVNYYNQKYANELGYRKSVANMFNNENAPKKAQYYQLAGQLMGQGGAVDQKAQNQEAIRLYGQMEIAPQYGRPQVIKRSQLSPKQIADRLPKKDGDKLDVPLQNDTWSFGDKPLTINKSNVSYLTKKGSVNNGNLTNAKINEIVYAQNPNDDYPGRPKELWALATVSGKGGISSTVENIKSQMREAGATEDEINSAVSGIIDRAKMGELPKGVSENETVWIPFGEISSELQRNFNFQGIDNYIKEMNLSKEYTPQINDAIDKFMKANGILDKNEAIKILKEAGRL